MRHASLENPDGVGNPDVMDSSAKRPVCALHTLTPVGGQSLQDTGLTSVKPTLVGACLVSMQLIGVCTVTGMFDTMHTYVCGYVYIPYAYMLR